MSQERHIAPIGRVVGGDEVSTFGAVSRRCGRDSGLWRDGWVGDAVEERLPWYHQEEHAHMARFGEGEAVMYTTILLAAALQNWDRYSTHALAAREVAATLAKGASHHLHVLSVYDPPPIDTGNLPAEIATRHREDLLRRTDALMVEKMDAYVAPLKAEGVEVTPILRVGDPREVIVQVATSMQADLLILGSHSKRGLLDIVLGGTAQQVSKSAPCLVVLVSPKKEEGG